MLLCLILLNMVRLYLFPNFINLELIELDIYNNSSDCGL